MFESICFKTKQTCAVGEERKKRKENVTFVCQLVSLAFPSPAALLLGSYRHQCDALSAALKPSKPLAALCCLELCFQVAVSWQGCKKLDLSLLAKPNVY